MTNTVSCLDFEILEENIDKVIFRKLKVTSADIRHIILLDPKERKLSFFSSITQNEMSFKCSYFVQFGHVTFTGDYLIDQIHTEVLLPTIIDFAMLVTDGLDEELTYEVAYELACVTKEVAKEYDEVKTIGTQKVNNGESTATIKTSNLVFLDQDFVIREKLAEFKH